MFYVRKADGGGWEVVSGNWLGTIYVKCSCQHEGDAENIASLLNAQEEELAAEGVYA